MLESNIAVASAAQPSAVFEQAMLLQRAGLSLAPILTDGSKAAAVRWRDLQHRYPTLAELLAWFGRPRPFGPAIIAGGISGNLEIIDCDYAPVWPQFRTRVLQRIPALVRGPVVRTPREGGGYQWYMRCAEPVPGNLKLAMRRNGAKLDVSLEAKGEGGYCLSPACPPKCHPNNKRYELLMGSFDAIPVISGLELAEVHSIAMTFDERPTEQPREDRQHQSENVGSRPGDLFNSQADWSAILEPFGWRLIHTDSDGVGYWRRPGKRYGISATTNYKRCGLLYNFSSNAAPFDVRAYGKFTAYALLAHHGNFSAAASALFKWGYRA